MIDILDELQDVNGYVKVLLRSGDVLYGVPDIIEFDDDEETGEIYEVLSIEKGWYRIVDDTGEDYLYPPEAFEIAEK